MALSEEARAARAAYMKKWKKDHPDKVAEEHRRWRQNHPEKVAEYNRRYWEKKAAAAEQQE